jgi:hypothetical protein
MRYRFRLAGSSAASERAEIRSRQRALTGGREPLPRPVAAHILRILESRGLRPTRAQRELIESCEDLDQLDSWFDRALTGTTAAASRTRPEVN